MPLVPSKIALTRPAQPDNAQHISTLPNRSDRLAPELALTGTSDTAAN
jgi:hypothetical protein